MEEEMKCPHCGKTIQIDNGKPTASAPASENEKEAREKARYLQRVIDKLSTDMAYKNQELTRQKKEIFWERKELACKEQNISALRDDLNTEEKKLRDLQKEYAELKESIKALEKNKP